MKPRISHKPTLCSFTLEPRTKVVSVYASNVCGYGDGASGRLSDYARKRTGSSRRRSSGPAAANPGITT